MIGDYATPITILYITGSRHSVTWWGSDEIAIGCHQYSIRLWMEKFREIGAKEDYNEKQIDEYERYIRTIASMYEESKNDQPL